ncbi:MAG: DoxX family protein [Verrucomicrobiota bacterium JB024]|nr:DoxX family protein [Verrucomicrobiota bacterium JB024]
MSDAVLSRPATIASWFFQIAAAGILLSTLPFKFGAAPESVALFEAIGLEPVGRIGTGVVELIAAFLLLWPRRAWLGALLSLGVMAGAIVTHVFLIGIVVHFDGASDGGALFAEAVAVFVSSLAVLFLRRQQLFALLDRVLK